MKLTTAALGGLAAIAGVAAHDLTQRRHSLLRTFPVIGHARFLVEALGPELRQYIVAANDEERPFNRDQRRWVYASAKKENNYFGFGTDNDMERSSNYAVIKHRTLTSVAPPTHDLAAEQVPPPSAKVLGGPRGRRRGARRCAVGPRGGDPSPPRGAAPWTRTSCGPSSRRSRPGAG